MANLMGIYEGEHEAELKDALCKLGIYDLGLGDSGTAIVMVNETWYTIRSNCADLDIEKINDAATRNTVGIAGPNMTVQTIAARIAAVLHGDKVDYEARVPGTEIEEYAADSYDAMDDLQLAELWA